MTSLEFYNKWHLIFPKKPDYNNSYLWLSVASALNIANSDKYDIPSLDLDDDEDLNEDGTCCVYVETTKEDEE